MTELKACYKSLLIKSSEQINVNKKSTCRKEKVKSGEKKKKKIWIRY